MYITNVPPVAAGAQKVKRRRAYNDPSQAVSFVEEIEVALSAEALERAAADPDQRQGQSRQQNPEQKDDSAESLDITV